jgi:hypothetical protein
MKERRAHQGVEGNSYCSRVDRVGPGFLAAGDGSFPSVGNGFDSHRPLQILTSYVVLVVSNTCFSFPKLARRSFFLVRCCQASRFSFAKPMSKLRAICGLSILSINLCGNCGQRLNLAKPLSWIES